jgi:hypothetical protein
MLGAMIQSPEKFLTSDLSPPGDPELVEG